MFATIITTESSQKYIYIFGIPVQSFLIILAILTAAYAIRSFMVSRRSNELRTVPTLIVKLRSSPNDTSSIEIVNLTSKMAYNIRLDPIFLRNYFDACLYKINFELIGENYIGSKATRPLKELKLKDGERIETPNFAEIVAKIKRSRNYPLVVRFNDSQGIKYFSELNFDNGSEKIEKSPTKLTPFWRARLWARSYSRYRKYKYNNSRKFARVHPDIKELDEGKIRRIRLNY